MNILDKIKDRRMYTYDRIEDGSEAGDDPLLVTPVWDNQPSEKTPIKIMPKNSEAPVHHAERTMITVNTASLSHKTSIEIEAMVSYILNKGKEIPISICALLPSHELANLIQAHNALSKIIAPSNPETISYVSGSIQTKKKRYLFSHIPLVRNFIIIAIISITSLIISGLSAEVNTATLSKGILNNSGLPLLKNLIFLCSGAGVGTVFFLLSKLTKAVKEATLSRDDTTYYWSMLIMGMLSGLILSEIVVLNHSGFGEQSIELNRLLFALLGGFSSEIVYGILQTIMSKIQGLVSGQ